MRKVFVLGVVLSLCASPALANYPITPEIREACRGIATAYTTSIHGPDDGSAAWKDAWFTNFDDCLDTYRVGGYYPCEGGACSG
jgi:hypothetical protein